MKTILTMLLFCVAGLAQTITGQTAISGQTASFTVAAKKIPKLTATATCTAPTDASGNYQVVAGTSIPCTATLNLVAPAAGATLTLVSSDTTQFTVPASVAIVAGATTVAFTLTATP